MAFTIEQAESVIANVTCSLFPTWKLKLSTEHGHVFLQVCETAGVDTFNGEPVTWSGRRWLIEPTMTETQIVNTCFKAYETAIEHEFRELFRYRGRPVYNPHRDINALCGLKKLDKEYASVGQVSRA
jgi:hypothetical protein